MISKYISSGSFKRSCNYVLNKKEAEVLCAVGVRSHDANLMAMDFEMQRLLHASKNNACFHGILSFHPNEKPDNALMILIAQTYLNTLGVENTQYAIVRHHDKNHAHLHIIANLVNNEGTVISDKWIGLRGKKAAQALTLKFGLIPAGEKKKIGNNQISLNKMELARNEIRYAITSKILQCSSLAQLEKALLLEGIHIQFKYRRGTQQIEGISFRKEEYSFKGSSIDRRFSYNVLQKIFRAIELKTKLKDSSIQNNSSKHSQNADSPLASKDNLASRFDKYSNSAIYQNTGDVNSNTLENVHAALAEIWNVAISLSTEDGNYFGHITEDKKNKKRHRGNSMRM